MTVTKIWVEDFGQSLTGPWNRVQLNKPRLGAFCNRNMHAFIKFYFIYWVPISLWLLLEGIRGVVFVLKAIIYFLLLVEDIRWQLILFVAIDGLNIFVKWAWGLSPGIEVFYWKETILVLLVVVLDVKDFHESELGTTFHNFFCVLYYFYCIEMDKIFVKSNSIR